MLGIVVGLAGACATIPVLASLLFGITPTDHATFAGLAAITPGVVVVASYLPARRAAALNRTSALRGG